MSYEHGFVKNGIVINLAQSLVSASSQNFKILDIPNILARGKLYGHGFAKKRDGHNFAQRQVSFGFSRTISEF
ncbi:hypothetical protein GW17_00038711 [Ensete ventricosum]|nr:hypothetical protein GW17_00038711 [Ensete ventricosum]